MKPPIKNEQVERILAVLIASYGLCRIFYSLPFIARISVSDYRFFESVHLAFYGQFLVDVGLLVFPVIIARWMAWFTTREKERSKRIWMARELAALPIVLYGMINLLALIPALFIMPFYSWREFFSADSATGGGRIFDMLLSLFLWGTWTAFCLFSARSISNFLVRKATASFEGRCGSEEM